MPRLASSPDPLAAAPPGAQHARRVRYRFGAAHLAKSLIWSATDLLLAWFLHTMLHMPAARVATLLFVLLLFGACCDALVGVLASWLRLTRRGLLWLHLAGSLATALTLVAQFAPGADWDQALVTGMLFRIAFAFYDVPQTALTTLLPADSADAARYVALRNVLSAAARLGVTVANLAIFQLPAAVLAHGTVLFASFGALATFSALALSFELATQAQPLFERRPLPALRFDLPPGTWRMLLAFLVSVAGLATLSRVLIFTPGQGALLLLLFSVGTVAGPLLVQRVVTRLGWNRAAAAAILFTGLSAIPLTLRPDAATLPAGFAYGVGLSGVGTLLWQMASDIIREHARNTGARSDGLVFGLVIFVIHLAVAIGALPLGLLIPVVARGAGAGLTGGTIIWASGALLWALLARSPAIWASPKAVPAAKDRGVHRHAA